MEWVYTDGGRKAAGFKGEARDCVCRAVAIITGFPYKEVYNTINKLAKEEKLKPGERKSSARTGLSRRLTRTVMAYYGFEWVPVMKIGSGCTMHLRREELPKGRIIANCSGHVVACIDGVVYDTFNSTRGGTRCVYGYWYKRY